MLPVAWSVCIASVDDFGTDAMTYVGNDHQKMLHVDRAAESGAYE